jgi:hypothetical protein
MLRRAKRSKIEVVAPKEEEEEDKQPFENFSLSVCPPSFL